MKKCMDLLKSFCIISFILVASFQQFFAKKISFADEVILFLLIGITIFGMILEYKKTKLNKKRVLCILIFLLLSIVNIINKNYMEKIVFIDFFNFFKVLIMIEIVRIQYINKKDEKIYMNLFIVANLVSMIYGIVSYIVWGYEPLSETIKYRDGKWRISGFSGHPIDLGFAALFITIYVIENKEMKSITKFFIVAVSCIAMLLTQSRLPQGLLILYIAMKICFEIKKKMTNKIKKYFILFIVLMILLGTSIIFYNIDYFLNYLSEDIDKTIRMHSIIKSFEVFSEYPILGTGIGTFGNKNSVIKDSFVYKDFNFRERFVRQQGEVTNNVFESNFAYVLIQTGMSGIIFYYMFFRDYFKKAIEINNNLLIYYLSIFLINFMLNQGYMLIILSMLTINISHTEYLYNKKTNQIE